MRVSGFARLSAVVLALLALPAAAQMSGMDMPMHKTGPVMRTAYTTNHLFMLKLVSVPPAIPYEKYFRIRMAVYDGNDPMRRLRHARVAVNVGMRHGMKTGFMHGMESAPRVSERDGIVTISGLYFHMMGPWTIATTVRADGKEGTAYFDLPCCAQ